MLNKEIKTCGLISRSDNKVHRRSPIIGVPCENDRWESNFIEGTPIIRLSMTCGGGMGGAHWYEYIDPEEFEVEDCLEALRTEDKVPVKILFSEPSTPRKLINTKYMVDAEVFYLYGNTLEYPACKYNYTFLSVFPKLTFTSDKVDCNYDFEKWLTT